MIRTRTQTVYKSLEGPSRLTLLGACRDVARSRMLAKWGGEHRVIPVPCCAACNAQQWVAVRNRYTRALHRAMKIGTPELSKIRPCEWEIPQWFEAPENCTMVREDDHLRNAEIRMSLVFDDYDNGLPW